MFFLAADISRRRLIAGEKKQRRADGFAAGGIIAVPVYEHFNRQR